MKPRLEQLKVPSALQPGSEVPAYFGFRVDF